MIDATACRDPRPFAPQLERLYMAELEAARALVEAQDTLPHADFEALCLAAGITPGRRRELLAMGRDGGPREGRA